jgi:hypothetical protein
LYGRAGFSAIKITFAKGLNFSSLLQDGLNYSRNTLGFTGNWLENTLILICLPDQPRVSRKTFADKTGPWDASMFGGQISMLFGELSISINGCHVNI